MVKEVQLEVAPILRQEDVGKRIARISGRVMKKLKVEEGDILEIKPEKTKKRAGF